jgi:8-oxo-dGTP pyrophosphatase MutT (NUDIX family)
MADIAPARPSASVILVRDGPASLETFMVRRHARSPVNPNVYVFPGGVVRADDEAFTDPLGLGNRSDTSVEPNQAAALYACALRELFEEAGVLLARDASGSLLAVDDSDAGLQDRLATARADIQAGRRSLGALLHDLQLSPAFDLLVPFSHWVTPTAAPARFDTWFFIAELPVRQVALHCQIETSDGVWLSPSALLDPTARGPYDLVFATEQHVRRLAPFDRLHDLLAFAAGKSIKRVQPELLVADGRRVPVMADELVDAW